MLGQVNSFLIRRYSDTDRNSRFFNTVFQTRPEVGSILTKDNRSKSWHSSMQMCASITVFLILFSFILSGCSAGRCAATTGPAPLLRSHGGYTQSATPLLWCIPVRFLWWAAPCHIIILHNCTTTQEVCTSICSWQVIGAMDTYLFQLLHCIHVTAMSTVAEHPTTWTKPGLSRRLAKDADDHAMTHPLPGQHVQMQFVPGVLRRIWWWAQNSGLKPELLQRISVVGLQLQQQVISVGDP